MADRCVTDPPKITKPKYASVQTFEYPKTLIAPPPEAPEHLLWPDTDTDSTGWYIMCPQEATNLLNNPTFFNSLSSWDTFNSKMYRQNQFAFDSGFAVRISGSGDIITAERREYIESEIFGYTAGENYTFSMYLWTPQLWATEDTDPISMTISIVDDAGEVFSEQLTVAQRWQRLEITKQIDPATTSVFVRINLRSADQLVNNPPFDPTGFFNLESEYIFADFGQFEWGSQATTPFHGDTNICGDPDQCGNYQWLGAAHDSPSHRSECARDGGVLCSLSSLGFEIISEVGTQAPPVTNISTPYANRPGEFCEATATNARIITFTGYVCGQTCELFEVVHRIYPNSGNKCCGEFLLVFRYEDCTGNCETDRDLAICVSYIGGLEGLVSSQYNNRYTLQFKAGDPYFFEFPGHSSTALAQGQSVQSYGYTTIDSDGTLIPSALSTPLVDHIECAAGGIAVVAGTFDSPDGIATDSQNLAIIDCNEICPGYSLFDGVTINDLTRDSSGNILIATSFGASIYYPSLGTFGSFPGYSGGAANAIAAPYWADVAIGSSTGVHIQLRTGEWLNYTANGPVYDLAVTSNGNIIAVGDFTTINGIVANRSAIFNINIETCDPSNAVWQPFPSGAGFDDALYAVAYDPVSGAAYVGGEATISTPYPQETCIVTSGQVVDSKGGSQELHFVDLGGNQYRVELRMTNVAAQAFADYCINSIPTTGRRFFRINATAPAGTQYSLLIGDFNITGTVQTNPAPLYAIEITVDLNQVLGDPCETLNPSFVDETETTKTTITNFATLTLPGGLGVDDTISSFTLQCVDVQESFQGDSTTINHVAMIIGNSVVSMDNGLDSTVRKLFVHPQTGEVYAITDATSTECPSTVSVWNGNYWAESSFSANGQITDFAWCPDSCAMMVSYQGSTFTGPSSHEVNYCGSSDLYDPQLIVHGPGLIEHFDVGDRIVKMCAWLACDEVAVYDFGRSTFGTTFGRNLISDVLPGSRKDVVLQANCPTTLSLLIDPETQEAETLATVIWRNKHAGSLSLCCSCLDTYAGDAISYVLNCCSTLYFNRQRAPTAADCENQGVSVGDWWFDASCCPALYVNIDNSCEDCENVGLIDNSGAPLHFDEDPATDDIICIETSP